MVYWSTVSGQDVVPQSKGFDTNEFNDVLKFMEGLRAAQRQDGSIRFVTYSIEHPDCVTKLGVDVTGPDYNWKKRRI